MRAMTMNIDEITGVGGMIVPGCHVDVNVLVADERSKQQTARTVLQDLKVVAVGATVTCPGGDAASAVGMLRRTASPSWSPPTRPACWNWRPARRARG